MKLRNLPDGSVFFLRSEFLDYYTSEDIRRMIRREIKKNSVRNLFTLFMFVSWLRTIFVGELTPVDDQPGMFQEELKKVDLRIYSLRVREVENEIRHEVNRLTFSHEEHLSICRGAPDKFQGNIDLLLDQEVVPIGLA